MKQTGNFLGIPYDWRRPTWRLVKDLIWSPEDPRILTPHVFGWGWSINLYQLLRRTGLIRGS